MNKTITIAYLGPAGTYTESAARSVYDTGKYLGCKTIKSVFEEVMNGKADVGIVPWENSLNGSVGKTLDLMRKNCGPVIHGNGNEKTKIHVIGEIEYKIEHCLVKYLDTIKVEKIVSHPQALEQCSEFIQKINAETIPVTSTTQGVKLASQYPTWAAIASERAAKKYGLGVANRNIADNQHNYTRFAIIGKKPCQKDCDKTSIAFVVKNNPGGLHDALGPFKKYQINMSKIQSRPLRNGNKWDYIMYADFEGNPEQTKVEQALEEMKKECLYLRILGSYKNKLKKEQSS